MPPSPIELPSLLVAVRELLQLRLSVAIAALQRRPSAQVTTLIAVILLLPAARQIGVRGATAALHPAPGTDGFAALTATLLLLLVAQTVMLHFASGFGIFGEDIPSSLLRPLPLPAGAIRVVEIVARFCSFPMIAVILAFAAIGMAFGIGSLVPLLLLLLLGLAGSLLLTRLATVFRGLWGTVGIALAILIPFAATFPTSALAAVLPKEGRGPGRAVHLRGDPAPPPPRPLPATLKWSPPGLAAQALFAIRKAPGKSVPSLLALAGLLGLTTTAVVALDRRIFRSSEEALAGKAVHALAPGVSRDADPFRTELRLLLRNPGIHLPLREPATLLMVGAYAWMVPNLGPDALGNLIDLCGMGAILYALLWQVQFLSNRFGCDAGTGTTLFNLPFPRHRLLIVKNAALLALLLGVDSIGGIGLMLVARSSHLIPLVLASLLPLLVIATALGNVLSVLFPFPIPKRRERREREPDRSLTFVYALYIGATALLFLPIVTVVKALGVVMGGGITVVYMAALYGASVAVVTRLLTSDRERRLAITLDGGER